jgi:hypothetical protein
VLFPRELALAVGGVDANNHYTMDYELWGKLFLAGAEFQYTEIPFGMARRHPAQKTANGARQTEALLGTAAKLVRAAGCLSQERKDEILADLDAYADYEKRKCWRSSGRLARIGLPPVMVICLRRLRVRLREIKDRCRSRRCSAS